MRPCPLFGLAMAAVLLSLGGCTSFSRALGLEKVVPDEFSVVQGPPLAVPPDYSLRPPNPGAAPTQETSASDQAKQSIFRATDKQASLLPGADKRSAGENQLLLQAGAGTVAPDIRDTVNREALASPGIQQGFVDKLLFWRDPQKPLGPTDNVIDAGDEAVRLKGSSQTADNGAPAAVPTTIRPSTPPPGMTGLPTIERKGDPQLL